MISFVLMPLFGGGTVINVPSQYSTIQEAIDVAADGDEIVVSPGTYYENIQFKGKNIVLRSTDPTSGTVVAMTIINGSSNNSVVTFSGSELTTCVLSGFTITSGSATLGGGVNGNETLATIQNNKIIANVVYGGPVYGLGGGIYDCDGTIQHNTMSGNTAGEGGGLAYCDGTIQHNIISGNSTSGGGGLLWCGGTIQNNTISENSASYGGGLLSCNGTIQNNVISGNMAGYGGGFYQCSGTIQNNTISGNSVQHTSGGLGWCDGTITSNTISMNSAGNGAGLYECNGYILNNVISDNSAGIGGGMETSSGHIEGNVITGNYAAIGGGGIAGCDGTILNNTLLDNMTDYVGGGLAWCGGIIQSNTITCNWAGDGGGGLYFCDGNILNNIILGNLADSGGGGLHLCDGTVNSNVISSNFAGNNGGGINDCQGSIRNCIIVKNTAPAGAQIYACATPSYSCIQDWAGGGTGNMADNPHLVDAGGGDFHLQAVSPCIDAGGTVTLAQDFEGDSRPWDAVTWEMRGDGSDFDMGADEFIGTALPTPTPSPTPTPTPTCLPCVVMVTGYVSDAVTSAPIVGAVVTLNAEDNETSDTTEASGEYEVALPVCAGAVNAEISASADGYAPSSVQRYLPCSEINRHDFTLVPLFTPTPTPISPVLRSWRLY